LGDEIDSRRHRVAELNVRERASVGFVTVIVPMELPLIVTTAGLKLLGDDRRGGLRKRRSGEGRTDEQSREDRQARRRLIHGTPF